MIIALGLLFCCASVLLARKVYRKHHATLQMVADKLTSKLKITAAFFSIVLLVGGVYQVNWPLEYLEFLGMFSIFEFDILRIFKFGCFVDYDAHSAVYGTGVILLLLEATVVIGLVIVHREGAGSSHKTTRKVVGVMLLVTYFVYPFGCKIMFSCFNCALIDGKEYLRSDLSIDCSSADHLRAEAFAGLMVAVFPIGLPLLYFVMLHSRRKELTNNDGTMNFLSFFYDEYEERYYYWETVECLRKCMLMGFATFFKPGTLMQLIAVIILTILYAILLAICKPCECRGTRSSACAQS